VPAIEGQKWKRKAGLPITTVLEQLSDLPCRYLDKILSIIVPELDQKPAGNTNEFDAKDINYIPGHGFPPKPTIQERCVRLARCPG
jgi:hypothetical protein